MSDLNAVSRHLGVAYDKWKQSEGDKDEYRDEFFELATKEVIARGLMTEAKLVYGPSEDEAKERAELYYPAHRVLEVNDSNDDDKWKVLLEERPELKAFTYVNRTDKKVYKRSIRRGSLQLDDDLMRERDNDLYMRVTEFPQWVEDLAKNFDGVYDYAFSRDVPRSLKPQDQIADEDLPLLQEYMYESAPKVQLAPPRKAKPEELDDE